MKTTVGKWGGSCAVRLPKMVVETLGLEPGSELSMTIKGDSVVLRPGDPYPTLEELVEQMKDCEQPELVWRDDVGKERW